MLYVTTKRQRLGSFSLDASSLGLASSVLWLSGCMLVQGPASSVTTTEDSTSTPATDGTTPGTTDDSQDGGGGGGGGGVDVSNPSLNVSSNSLAWGSITTATSKTITLSVASAGTNHATLTFSGDTTAFKIVSVGGVTKNLLASAGSVSTDVSYGFGSDVEVVLLPVRTTGSAVSMNISVADGASTVVATRTATHTFLSPMQVSGLVGWFNAEAITGIADGALVGTWPNSADDNTPAIQTNNNNKPAFVASSQNGLPSVAFSDNGFWSKNMASAGLIPATDANVRSIVAVATITGGGFNAGRTIAGWGKYGAGGSFELGYNGGAWFLGASAGQPNGGFSAGTNLSTQLNAFKILTTVYDGSNLSLWVNGTLMTTTTAVTLTTSANGLYIGNGFVGNISEIGIYNTALGSTSRESVECHLSSRYGISVTQTCP